MVPKQPDNSPLARAKRYLEQPQFTQHPNERPIDCTNLSEAEIFKLAKARGWLIQ